MAKNKTRKRKKDTKKKDLALLFFTVFAVAAILIVLLLEYIDHEKGRDSFIFNKVFSLPTKNKQSPGETSVSVSPAKNFNFRLKKLLDREKVNYEHFKDNEGKFHFKFTLDYNKYESFIERMKWISTKIPAQLSLSEIRRVDDKSMMLFSLHIAHQVTHIILVTRLEKQAEHGKKTKDKAVKKKTGQEESTMAGEKQEPVESEQQLVKKPLTKPAGKPAKVRVAFIIDDVGEYAVGSLELKQLGIPITASILPDSPQAYQEAQWLDEYHLEAMLHIPMQPRNSNGESYKRGKTITMTSTDAEMESLIKRARQVVPQARGVNNHMGSLVTADAGVMERFLEILKKEGLFFIDSRTIGSSVGYDVAQALGVKTAVRDVFLDDGVKSYEKAVGKIKELVDIAVRKGSAIAIGHPHPTTIRAINDSIKFIKARGIEIVFVSELLH